MKKIFRKKICIRIMSLIVCIPLLFFCPIYSFAAAEELDPDVNPGEYQPDIKLYDGKPNQTDWTSFSNLVSNLIIAATGAELAYNFAEEIVDVDYNYDQINWSNVFIRPERIFENAPIYVADSDTQKLRRVDDVNDIFGTHIGELYIPSDESLSNYQPLFEVVFEELDNSSGSSVTLPSWLQIVSDYSSFYSFDIPYTPSAAIRADYTDHTYSVNSTPDGLWGNLYRLERNNSGYSKVASYLGVSFNNGILEPLTGAAGYQNAWEHNAGYSSPKLDLVDYGTGMGTNNLSSVKVWGNFIIQDQSTSPNKFYLFYDGTFLEELSLVDGKIVSQYTSVEDMAAHIPTSTGAVFSSISSLISSSNASGVGNADADALRRAANVYQNATDKDAALSEYIAALSAALAIQNETQEEVSQDVKGIALSLNSVISWLQKIYYAILNLPTTIISSIKAVGQSVVNIYNLLTTWDFATWFAKVIQAISSIPATIIEWLNNFLTDISTFWNTVTSTLANIWEAISSWSFLKWVNDIISAIEAVPGAINEYIESLFVMDAAAEARVETKAAEVFEPVLWIKDFTDEFRVAFIRIFQPVTEPPKIPIHLDNNTSKYNWGGDEYILDLTFWAPYKRIADPMIVVFCWVVFLWHLFKSIPSLLSGGDGIVSTMDPYVGEKNFHLSMKASRRAHS